MNRNKNIISTLGLVLILTISLFAGFTGSAFSQTVNNNTVFVSKVEPKNTEIHCSGETNTCTCTSGKDGDCGSKLSNLCDIVNEVKDGGVGEFCGHF